MDDDRLLPLNGDELRLRVDTYKEFYDVSHEHKLFLFLDEIQNIPNCEKWIKSTYDKEQNIKIVISGSNASLLSGDLSKLLTGRHLRPACSHSASLNTLMFMKSGLNLVHFNIQKKISK